MASCLRPQMPSWGEDREPLSLKDFVCICEEHLREEAVRVVFLEALWTGTFNSVKFHPILQPHHPAGAGLLGR